MNMRSTEFESEPKRSSFRDFMARHPGLFASHEPLTINPANLPQPERFVLTITKVLGLGGLALLISDEKAPQKSPLDPKS